ncbi:hypothetical protein DPMN_126459 [Dreissena polymorpha]|uniref:Uncharacterized protein n=1 Tax=Dreissena polymorpha TaxID=45954 RepID=A0A9D4GXC9_DREPO|nr:hypothetical protein DPMN_126459 [Dreissena polymorpha]
MNIINNSCCCREKRYGIECQPIGPVQLKHTPILVVACLPVDCGDMGFPRHIRDHQSKLCPPPLQLQASAYGLQIPTSAELERSYILCCIDNSVQKTDVAVAVRDAAKTTVMAWLFISPSPSRTVSRLPSLLTKSNREAVYTMVLSSINGNFWWVWPMWAGRPRVGNGAMQILVEIDRIVIREVQYQFEVNRSRNKELNFQGSSAFSVGGDSGQDGRTDRQTDGRRR